ncbi:hypothetical protein Clacol_000148 [Clathrus columnatus]|uniref:Uncharacterized protein n=1 Tax=Clathrus columnatus TaxID=1419009 RepID=A0AAV5A064_9AGAM|nr:hypothetical protein Clacol_000148 [Clathrus columnatus]
MPLVATLFRQTRHGCHKLQCKVYKTGMMYLIQFQVLSASPGFDSRENRIYEELYWEFHTDTITALDGSAATLLTTQYNLCAGTLATFGKGKLDVEKIISEGLDYRVSYRAILLDGSRL